MITCNVCCQWRPQQWDGSIAGWSDTAAWCKHKGKFTTANETCDEASLVPKIKIGGVNDTVRKFIDRDRSEQNDSKNNSKQDNNNNNLGWDSDADSPTLYKHQQEVIIDFFEGKETIGFYCK